MKHVRIIRTLARASVVETLRRKDLYVVLILAALLMAAGGLFRVIGVQDLEILVRDVTLSVVNLVSVVFCIMLSARQFPEEIQRRTLRPLLARPISRWHLVAGKFAAAVLMSIAALLGLMAVASINLAMCGVSFGAAIWQYLLLRCLALLVVGALTMALSLVLTPAACVTVSLLAVLGSSTFGNTLRLLPETTHPVTEGVLRFAYFLLPQLDLFDMRAKVTYDWAPVPPWVILFLAGYALLYSGLFLGLAIYRFRRQAL